MVLALEFESGSRQIFTFYLIVFSGRGDRNIMVARNRIRLGAFFEFDSEHVEH